MKTYEVKVLGTGIYAPKKIVTNKDLESIVETNDEWIFERTGIRERRICSTDGGEFPTDMAKNAAIDALMAARLVPNDIDLILFASVTPDVKLPNSASILQVAFPNLSSGLSYKFKYRAQNIHGISPGFSPELTATAMRTPG